MKIAILGWGSLIWCPKNLAIIYAGDSDNTYRGWYTDGPELPIEFARVSGRGKPDERLTLVIHGSAARVRTLWALSRLDDYEAAKANLNSREGCRSENPCVGAWRRGQSAKGVTEAIARWAAERPEGLDAVIWTSLCAKDPRGQQGWNPSVEDVVSYIRSRKDDEHSLKSCVEYIRNTPEQIETEFRTALKQVCDELMPEE
jgi:hypothetical protein